MSYTVFEHIERGTRFFTDYSPKGSSDVLKIVKHVETISQAQEICAERDEMNWKWFWEDMLNKLTGKI